MRRERAKGATFFEATEGETVRPMLDVAWAPMLGAFSVLFEEFHEGAHPFAPACVGFPWSHSMLGASSVLFEEVYEGMRPFAPDVLVHPDLTQCWAPF